MGADCAPLLSSWMALRAWHCPHGEERGAATVGVPGVGAGAYSWGCPAGSCRYDALVYAAAKRCAGAAGSPRSGCGRRPAARRGSPGERSRPGPAGQTGSSTETADQPALPAESNFELSYGRRRNSRRSSGRGLS
jgi:hypothetical protein